MHLEVIAVESDREALLLHIIIIIIIIVRYYLQYDALALPQVASHSVRESEGLPNQRDTRNTSTYLDMEHWKDAKMP